MFYIHTLSHFMNQMNLITYILSLTHLFNELNFDNNYIIL